MVSSNSIHSMPFKCKSQLIASDGNDDMRALKSLFLWPECTFALGLTFFTPQGRCCYMSLVFYKDDILVHVFLCLPLHVQKHDFNSNIADQGVTCRQLKCTAAMSQPQCACICSPFSTGVLGAEAAGTVHL